VKPPVTGLQKTDTNRYTFDTSVIIEMQTLLSKLQNCYFNRNLESPYEFVTFWES